MHVFTNASYDLIDAGRCVVRVGPAVVVLAANGDGVGVTIYPSNTDLDSVAETWATWSELEDDAAA